MERRSTTGRRRRITTPRLRHGTCSSPRTSTRPRPAARSHRARLPRSSTMVGCARAGWVAPATGTCTTTSASPSTPRPAWRPSPTATISPGMSGRTTTPPSRRKRWVPRSVRAPDPEGDYDRLRGGGCPSAAPVVEPLSRLLSQLPLRHLVAQDLGWLEATVFERLEEMVRDREPHVEAHEVGELERAHRMVVSELHRLVDVLRRGDTLLEHAHRFEPERDPQPAGGEPGRILHDDGLLAERPREGDRPLDGPGGGLWVRHYLDELHRVHGIEEVHAEDATGVLHGGCDRGDGERGGIGRQQRARGRR